MAIKHFKNPKGTDLKSHKTIMQIIGNHNNVLRLLDCIMNFQTKVPSTYCIYSPLAAMTLGDVIRSYDANAAAQITLLRDYLAGLSHLHEQCIMHRDVKPENQAIRSILSPIGVILDLDAATTSQTSTDHMKGTVPFLTPEIIELKDWNPAYNRAEPHPYEKSVDSWAFRLSMFALFKRQYWRWLCFSHTDGDKPNKLLRN